MLCAVALVLGLTRAEIVQRMRAPVINQSDGLVRVYADCGEDLRKEYQMPVARFAAETVRMLWRGLGRKSPRFPGPALIYHIGDLRTNVTDVVVRVSTNGTYGVVTRFYLKSPAFADLSRLRIETVKAFYRRVAGRELSDDESLEAFRLAFPEERIRDARRRLEDWLSGRVRLGDEEALKLLRKIHEPGVATHRDVLTFASRLYLYPVSYDRPFSNGKRMLAFSEAIGLAESDEDVRGQALSKARELPVFGGGRGEPLAAAAAAYAIFLTDLGRAGKDAATLRAELAACEALLLKAEDASVGRQGISPAADYCPPSGVNEKTRD